MVKIFSLEWTTPPLVYKHKGFLNIPELVKFVRGWLSSELYLFFETKHVHKSDEDEIEVYGKRKLNEYVQYTLYVEMKAEEISEVEIVKEGQKIKTQKGRIKVTVHGTMNLDWQKRFAGNKFLQYIQYFYHRYIIKEKIEDVWQDHLMLKAVTLKSKIQEKLESEV